MELRAPGPDDAPAVHAVLAARDLADLGSVEYTLDDLNDEWGQTEFDLAADAIVAELDRRIVAYGEVRSDGGFGAVAPEHEGRGIGALVLSWIEGRMREQGRDTFRHWTATSNTRAAELLRAAGYAHERAYWRLVRPLAGTDVDAAAPALPPGYAFRKPEPERDATALHSLDAASFAAVPDYRPHSFTAFCEEHLRAHDLDLGLSGVVEHDDDLVGFLLARRWQERSAAFIDLLGVHPDHQRRGLGSALLLAAFADAAAAGLSEAQLGVAGDNPRALTLYERIGMTPRYQFDAYARPV